MPSNKNALIRYKTIDNCLRNRYRKWTLDDLVEACSLALYDMEGITKGVSVRTVQNDIQIMRSDKLGYNAPIEVYDHKYYRYADSDYCIMNMPMSQNDLDIMQEVVDILRQFQDFDQFSEMSDVVGRLQDKLSVSKYNRKPIIHFDSVSNLKGLKFLNPIYNYIAHKQTVRIMYKSFNAKESIEYIMYPYLLKEFRNRWFLFGSKSNNMTLYNLALDRIESIEAVDVAYRENPDFDTEHYFDNVIGVSKNIHQSPRQVKFWASEEQSRYIKTKPLHPSQKLIYENPEDGSCIFRIIVCLNYELYSVLMSYGPGIKLLSPRNAVNYLKKQLQEAARLYDEDIPNLPEP
ncbi:MAG: WYL domain-containing protein [Bacteroidales bacterium]|nr:WYL domain-containing protein [Bacteroidales bacterium]